MKMRGWRNIASFVLAFVLASSFLPVAFAQDASEVRGGSDEKIEQSRPSAIRDSVVKTPNAQEGVSEECASMGDAEKAPDSYSNQGVSADDIASSTDSLMDEETPEGDSEEEGSLFSGAYLVRSALSDVHVLDIVGGSSSDGGSVQLYSSNMSTSQQFVPVLQDDGTYAIRNVNSNKVLDVAGGSAFEGADVQQYEWNGTDAQKWNLLQNEDGSYTLASALNGQLVLDVSGGNAKDGAKIQLYTRNGTPAQNFVFMTLNPEIPAPSSIEPGVYRLASAKNQEFVVDVPSSSVDDGTDLHIWVANGTIAQSFYLEVDETGYATIMSVNSGKMLDLEGGNLVNGTRVQQWNASDTANQRWSPQMNSDGTITLVSCANGLALDVCDGTMANGSALQTFSRNGTAAQSWILVPVEQLLSDGVFEIVTLLDSSKVLDVPNGTRDEGASLNIWTRNSTPAQRYRITNVSQSDIAGVTVQAMTSGHYMTGSVDGSVSLSAADGSARQVWIPSVNAEGGIGLINAATGKALDVSWGGTYDGCPIRSYEPNGTKAQSFRPLLVDPVSYGTYIIQSCADGRVLDVSGGSRSNGANVQVWSRNDSGAQAWVISSLGDGYYRVENARSAKSLDVTGGSTASGTNVQQWATADVPAQKWRIVVNDDCSLTFVSACGDKALDVSAQGGYDGANVQVYEQNGSSAQRWRLVPTTYVRQDFEDLLGSFATYSTNTPAGTYNMQRALNSFNGVVIQPGATLSFFGVAGPCGAAEGYLPAGVVGGVGYGGGICQASTTLYGAAIRAGFGIVDRQNHSVPSTYVPIGLDAMVNWGTSDLVIRNDTGSPAKIVTYTYGNVLTCEIWGIQPDWYDSIEPVSWYTSGSTASAQRVFYKDGMAVRTEWLPSSYYY